LPLPREQSRDMRPETQLRELPGCISRLPASGAETGAVVILAAGPNVIELSGPGHWLVAEGYGWTGSPPGRESLSSLDRFADWLESSFQMASGILVVGEDEPRSVCAYRGISSTCSWYYCLGDDRRSLILSDAFRNVLSAVPLEHRGICEPAVVDHFLFRTSPGRLTLVRGIKRLAFGEGLELKFRGQEALLSVRQLGRLIPPRSPGRVGHSFRRRLGETLDSVLGLGRFTSSDCNLFSGGIDSTLVQTSARSLTPLNVTTDTPEFACEGAYARSAATLLGVHPQSVATREVEFGQRLESLISDLCLPPHHLQSVLIDAALQQAQVRRCVSAYDADGLFGFGYHRAAFYSRLFGPLLPLTKVLASRLPGRVGLRAREWYGAVQDDREQISKPLLDPDGLSCKGIAIFTDMDRVRRVFGDKQVGERLRARALYALERVELPLHASLSIGQLELTQWVDFFCENASSLWRELALVRGVDCVIPFRARSLIDLVLSIPATERYQRWGRPKYLLKDLLAARVPGYNVNRRKCAGGLPLARFLTTGPLRQAFDDCHLPDFIPADMANDMRTEPGWTAWNALTFSMWKKLALDNPRLTTVPDTRRILLKNPQAGTVTIRCET
jgi:asparagine synthetase B (glutamine-hydrolysing)